MAPLSERSLRKKPKAQLRVKPAHMTGRVKKPKATKKLAR